jgi:putative transposase
MIRIQLDETTRDELKALRRDDLPHKVRDRIEMVSLADAGWSAPKIAGHLGCHPQTVRDLLRDFRDRGVAALRPKRSGPAPDDARYVRVVAIISELLSRKRTWSSRQVAEELALQGIALGARQVRRYLRRMGARLSPHRHDLEA